jgi:hypothetical protein
MWVRRFDVDMWLYHCPPVVIIIVELFGPASTSINPFPSIFHHVDNVTVTHGASTLTSMGILLEVIKSPLSEHRIGRAPRRIARWARECSSCRVSFLNLCITSSMIVLGSDLDRVLPHRLL